MVKYYLTDDSCEPLDIGSLSVVSTDDVDKNDCDWCYDSKEDLIAELKRQLKSIQDHLCNHDGHEWRYGMTYSKCDVCNKVCSCEFVSMRNATTQTCAHCSREELA